MRGFPMMYDYAKDFDFYLCPSATRKWGEGEDYDESYRRMGLFNIYKMNSLWVNGGLITE